jgi:hypothetical protein
MENNQTIAKIKQIVPHVNQNISIQKKFFLFLKAVQCLHEINGRTRHEAYLIIIKCARLWTSCSEQSFIGKIFEF